MSFHYPHHVGKIGALRSNRERLSDFLSRDPQVTEYEAGEILTFARTRRYFGFGRSRTNPKTRLNARTRSGANWGEGWAVLGGLVVLPITAWLIWGAFAEAAMAVGDPAAHRS